MPFPSKAYQHIRAIQIKATREVNDLFGGIYRSVFKGRGLEFEEVREYQAGDDIRSIDWNVTARMQNPYVKNYQEERELTVMLIVDISSSAHFGHSKRLKSELIAEIGAVLAFSAIKNHDKVGLLLFSNQIELYLPPKKGKRHVLRVIRELLFFKPQHNGTDLYSALSFLGKVQKHKSICFLISDFIGEICKQELLLTAKRHEVIAIQIYDDYERQFPSLGLMTLKDLESNNYKSIDTSNLTSQKDFVEKSKQKQIELQKSMSKASIDLISIRTTDSYIQILHHFFKTRGSKH